MLRLITQSWQDTDIAAKARQSSSTQINGTASELLRVAMSIECIAQKAIMKVIECVQNGQINGRSAIYCISEVRVALLSRDFTDKEALSEAITDIKTIAELCIRPFYAANTNTLHLQEASVCLDLFPAVINLLSTMERKSNVTKNRENGVLTAFMRNQWHPSGFLPLCCVVSELFDHLERHHLQEFRVSDYQI